MTKNEELVWVRQIEFILTLLSFAVGLGNVWRFPYLCYQNGGGAFLLPYFISLALIGIPVFFVEISVGQFSGADSVKCWNMSPVLRGIGYSCILITFSFGCYYNIIVSICLQYLFHSWKKTLPWTLCNASWNKNCTPGMEAEQFFDREILGRSGSGGFGKYGNIMNNMVISYFFAWFFVFCCLSFSIKTLGKVAYITGIFPYIMITILVVRSALLPGSKNGISFYLKPNISKIKQATVWRDAASQIFYSLSIAIGGIISLSSHNKFKNNAIRDSILVPILNCATSFYVGFSVFAITGYLAHVSKKSVPEVVQNGFGLVFVAYPTGLAKLPLSQLWSTLFFFMMVLLGVGSMGTITEGLLYPLENMLPNKGRKWSLLFRVTICFVSFMFGLPMCFEGGNFLLTIIDSGLSMSFFWIGIFELIAVMYIYGYQNFKYDIKFMTNINLNYYWLISLNFVAPIALIVILLSGFKNFDYASSATTTGSKVLNILVFSFPVIIITFYAIGYLIVKRYRKIPEDTWLPRESERLGYKTSPL